MLLAITGGSVLLATHSGASATDPTHGSAGMIGWWRSIGLMDGPAPVRMGDLLVTVDRAGSLAALDPVSGRPKWRAPMAGVVATLDASAPGGLAAADDVGTLAWVDPEGHDIWRAHLGVGITGLAVGERLVAATGGSTVLVVDRSDGSERWRVDLGGTVMAAPRLTSDQVVVGSGESIVALAPDTGEVAWSMGLGDPVTRGLALAAGFVVAADWAGDLVALDPSTGALRWQTTLPAGVDVDLAAEGDAIALVDNAGSVAVLDAATGALRWRHDTTDSWVAFGSPQLADGVIRVVDTDGSLHVLDASDGSERWSYGVGLSEWAPVTADGLIHVQTLEGPLVTLGAVADPRRPARPSDPDTVASASGSAPMAGGGPAGTGWRPGPGPVGTPVVLWRTEVDGELTGGLVGDGDLVTGGGLGSVLYGFDALTGEVRWRFATAHWIMYPPAMVGDQVIVGDEASRAYGVDRGTGTGRWATALDSPPGAPIVTDGERAYVLTRARTLVALDAATGAVAWTLPNASAPAVAGGVAWVVTETGVVAVDAATGTPRWKQPGDFPRPYRPTLGGERLYVPDGTLIQVLDAATGVPEPFVLYGGATGMTMGDGVAVLATGGTVSGLDLATGFVRWTSASVSGEFVPVTPTLVGDDAYLATGDLSGLLIALDARDGLERWRFDTGSRLMLTPPAVVGQRVFLSVGSSALALGDPGMVVTAAPSASPAVGTALPAGSTGPAGGPRTTAMAGGDAARSGTEPGPAPQGTITERWRVEAPGEITGGPTLTADLIAVTTDEGWLLALDPVTGHERWRTAIEPGGAATPLIDGDVVHVVDGGVGAFDAATGELLWRMDGVASTDPLLAGHTLLASGPSGLVAIDVGGARGLESWRFQPHATGTVGDLSRPTLVDGVVTLVSPATRGGPGNVWALDLTTGSPVWQRDDLAAVTSSTATGGVAAVGTRRDTIAWLDAASGETLSEADIGGRAASAPSTDGDTWYVGTDEGDLVAVDRDGAVRWTFTTDDSIVAQPSIAGDMVVVASYDGFVYGLERSSGAERWRFETGREMKDAPSVVDAVVIVAAGSELIAIQGGH